MVLTGGRLNDTQRAAAERVQSNLSDVNRRERDASLTSLANVLRGSSTPPRPSRG
jgi:hypothetical protein